MTGVTPDLPDNEEISHLLATALDLLDQEREIFVTGRYDEVPALNERKRDVLDRLQIDGAWTMPDPVLVRQMEALLDASRRNQEIIAAAREGLRLATRRLAAIKEMENGVVAYRQDGAKIRSRADATSVGRSA